MTRALSSEEPLDLDPVAFVAAVKTLVLIPQQLTMRALAERDSYEEMAEFATNLKIDYGVNLFSQARNWIAASHGSERNPEASQLMALLLLFSPYTPAVKDLPELMNLLPLTWPSALAHLREACLDWRAALVQRKSSASRRDLLALLNERYGG
ncbi:hypothetical protein H6CHR_01835 [Variovorax sp. PBL-H6]|nr:hypothetical protein H6CHR_01835 [Variovorax sp. PBL-H6]